MFVLYIWCPPLSQSRLQRVLLQGSDRLYLSTPEELPPNNNNSQLNCEDNELEFDETDVGGGCSTDTNNTSAAAPAENTDHDRHAFASSNKQWLVMPIPYSYTAANYPIRVRYNSYLM